MKSALNLISELEEETIRDVHAGEISRSVLSHTAEEEGFPKSAGEYAHRLIRAHGDVDALIWFYKRNQQHKETAAESPAVKKIDGNTAAVDLDVIYPQGPPIVSKEDMMSRMNVDEFNPEDWKISWGEVGHWGGQQQVGPSGAESVVYLNLFKGSLRLKRKERQPEFEPPKPVEVMPATVDPPDVEVDSLCPDGWETALVWGDPHYGVKRDERTGDLIPLHDRHAIELLKQVAALAEVDHLVCSGDGIDAPAISDYVGTPDLTRTLQPSLCEFAYDWDQIRHATQPKSQHLIEGNHDERIRETLLKSADELYGVRDVDAIKDNRPPQLSLRSLLRLDEKGIQWHGDYPDGEVILNDGVAISHDWTLSGKSGKTAYQMIRDQNGEVSRIQGHGHRHEVAWKTSWRGDRRAEYFSAMLGCLCRLDGIMEGTKAKQNWQQSFALVHFDPDGWHHTFEPVKVLPARKGGAHKECDFRGRRLRSREPDLERLSKETGIRYTKSEM